MLRTSGLQTTPSAPAAVVPAFNGRAEKFILRAFRLFRRSLMDVHGDAGKILTKHLRTHIPDEAFADAIADLSALHVEIHVLGGMHDRANVKWSSKQEFFLIALIEASQRHDSARASEAAIALLDTFEVVPVIAAARAFAQRLADLGLRLMPIGDDAFSYFAEYKAIDEPTMRQPPRLADISTLRIVGSA